MESFERLLEASGAKRIKTAQFTDVYFDTPELALTRANHYLRTRDGCWELKVPSKGDSLETSVFEELTTEPDIAEYFATCFETPLALPFAEPRSAGPQQAHALHVLMAFDTRRSSWRLGSSMSVDVDMASTGACLAEFEVICESEVQVGWAQAEIDRVCRDLGLAPPEASCGAADGQPPGKFERFILEDPALLPRVQRHAPHIIERFLRPPRDSP